MVKKVRLLGATDATATEAPATAPAEKTNDADKLMKFPEGID